MKDKHLVFFDEASTVTDEDLKKFGDILSRQTGKHPAFEMKYGPSAIGHVSSAHLSRGKSFHGAFVKAIGEAVHTGVGAVVIDSFTELEEKMAAMHFRNWRGGGKSNLQAQIYEHLYTRNWEKHTVKHDLNQLQTAQARTASGKDALFEAMEIHNERIRLGRKAVKEMFHAMPLHIHPYLNGPKKAKDWE